MLEHRIVECPECGHLFMLEDGDIAREECPECNPEVTLEDVDRAIESIPDPVTYQDYLKVWEVLPGGKVREIKNSP